MKVVEQTTDTIRNQILDKAFDRFGRYGFGKTTMVEIAQDCEMSAGNLYRYFENKKDIGAGCTQRCMTQAENLLREVVRKPGWGPVRRLEEFVLAKLRYIHSQFSEQPLLQDLVMYVSTKRWDLVGRHLEVQRGLIAEILAEGNRTGDFDVREVSITAQRIQDAIAKFNAPQLVSVFPREQLEKEAKGVVTLLIQGLVRS